MARAFSVLKFSTFALHGNEGSSCKT